MNMSRMNAPTVRYCAECRKWSYVSKADGPFTCPNCHKIQRRAKCNRCGYEWELHRAYYPMNCPGCKTPYYNKARVQSRAGEPIQRSR